MSRFAVSVQPSPTRRGGPRRKKHRCCCSSRSHTGSHTGSPDASQGSVCGAAPRRRLGLGSRRNGLACQHASGRDGCADGSTGGARRSTRTDTLSLRRRGALSRPPPEAVTNGAGTAVEFDRAYYVCPQCQKGQSPLDSELGVEGTHYFARRAAHDGGGGQRSQLRSGP
jgi:hypothetical protein